jgi:hypothetical protein
VIGVMESQLQLHAMGQTSLVILDHAWRPPGLMTNNGDIEERATSFASSCLSLAAVESYNSTITEVSGLEKPARRNCLATLRSAYKEK